MHSLVPETSLDIFDLRFVTPGHQKWSIVKFSWPWNINDGVCRVMTAMRFHVHCEAPPRVAYRLPAYRRVPPTARVWKVFSEYKPSAFKFCYPLASRLDAVRWIAHMVWSGTRLPPTYHHWLLSHKNSLVYLQCRLLLKQQHFSSHWKFQPRLRPYWACICRHVVPLQETRVLYLRLCSGDGCQRHTPPEYRASEPDIHEYLLEQMRPSNPFDRSSPQTLRLKQENSIFLSPSTNARASSSHL